MGDLAKIGMVVESHGVEEARAQLANLGKTGEVAGSQLYYLGNASNQTSAGLAHVGGGANSSATSVRNLHLQTALLLDQFGAFGPAGSLVTRAVLSLGVVAGVSAAIIGSAIIGAKIGLAPEREQIQAWEDMGRAIKDTNIDFFTKKMEEVKSTVESRGGFFGPLIEQFQRIKDSFTGGIGVLDLKGLNDRTLDLFENKEQAVLNKMKEITRESRLQNDLIGVSAVRAIELQAHALETRLFDAAKKAGASRQQADELAKQQASTFLSKSTAELSRATAGQVLQLNLEAAALGASASQTIALATAQKIAALTFARASQEIIEQTLQLGKLKIAMDQIVQGKQLVSEAKSQFGFEIKGSELVDQLNFGQTFVSGLRASLATGSTISQAAPALGEFIKKALNMGIKDIGGLLMSPLLKGALNPAELSQLEGALNQLQIGVESVDETFSDFKQNVFGGSEKIGEHVETRLVPVFGDTLVKAMHAADTASSQWSEAVVGDVKRYVQAAGEAGAQIDALRGKLGQIDLEVAKERALKLNIADFIGPIDTAREAINSIPDVTVKYLIIRTLFEASPSRPFGEFIPYMRRTFDDLEQLAARAPEINFAIDHGSNAGGSRTAPTSGGGDSHVHFDLRGAAITREVWDGEILPRLEKAQRRTTGTRLKTRTFN